MKEFGPATLWKALRFRDRLTVSVLLIFFGGALVVWIGAGFMAVTKEVPTHGGRYVEGIVGQPRYLNPILSQVNAADEDLVSVIYPGLTGYDRDGRIVNRLAEKIDVSDDGLTYVVTLRNGLTWHDGAPLTADDVAFTVDSIKDPAYRSPLRQKWQGVDVEVRDPRTVAFILKKAYFGFPEHLTVGILPMHIWGTVAPERFALADANLSPVGSGPYRFVSFQKDARGNILSYELRSFPGYIGGEPFIDKLAFSFYPDEETMIAAYGRKEIMGMSPLSSERGSSFAAKKGTTVHDFHLPRVFSVFFNPVKSVPLAYSEVRQALSMATDRDALVRDALAGRGMVTTMPFLSFMEGNPSVPSVATDVSGANGLLDDKGWKKGDDGIRMKGQERLAFDLQVPDWPELRVTADLLRAQWRAVGADVTVKVMPLSELNRDVIRPREYQALLYGEEMGVNPDFYSFWHSSEKSDPGLNLAMFDDSSADDTLLSLREESDPAKRDALLGTFLGILAQKNPAVFLYSPDVFYVMSDAVKGFDTMSANGASSRFSGIEHWYIDTKRVLSRYVQGDVRQNEPAYEYRTGPVEFPADAPFESGSVRRGDASRRRYPVPVGFRIPIGDDFRNGRLGPAGKHFPDLSFRSRAAGAAFRAGIDLSEPILRIAVGGAPVAQRLRVVFGKYRGDHRVVSDRDRREAPVGRYLERGNDRGNLYPGGDSAYQTPRPFSRLPAAARNGIFFRGALSAAHEPGSRTGHARRDRRRGGLPPVAS